jgi:predicted aspartyl protease
MMHGIVNQNGEATIRLVVGNGNGERQMIDAVIDTVFTGFLTLPITVITNLNLQLYSREDGTLGDGSMCIFDVYRGFVIWDGEWKRIFDWARCQCSRDSTFGWYEFALRLSDAA